MPDKSLVVFTALFGDYDVLLDPKNPSEDVDYICFTDGSSSIDSEIWEERKISFKEDLTSKMKAAKVMMFPHVYLPDYKYSVYIDANIEINGNIETLVEKYLSTNKLAILRHPHRDGVYQEAQRVIEVEKADPETVRRQMKRYRKEGLPENNGLAATRVILRRHNNPEIIDMMEDWLKEMKKGGKRDQLSFNYITWKDNHQPTYMDEQPVFERHSSFFSVHPHKPDGWRGEIFEYLLPISARLELGRDFYYYMEALGILQDKGFI